MQGNRITKQFLDLRAKLDDQLYLPATIAFHAAPVYAGLKPSVLINLGHPESRLAQMWTKHLQAVDNFMGLSLVVFYGAGGCRQLFCYDSKHLEQILADRDIRAYLESIGFGCPIRINDILSFLQKGFLIGCPHEIGIFLGYPLSDVKAFIRNNGQHYLLNGYWKVYSDVSRAVRMFRAL